MRSQRLRERKNHNKDKPIILWRIIRRGLRISFTLFAILLILELFFFAKVLFTAPSLEPAGMVVCFEGAEGRARAAYSLADQGYADVLVISPADKNKLERYDRRFKPTQHFIKVMENSARTTFENALYTSRIVKRHHIKSVILVTSWNHMPRSLLLLKLMLLGNDTKIYPYTVATKKLAQENWYRHKTGWKMFYNEMMEYWGSLTELLTFQIRGAVPAKAWKKSDFLKRLKPLILFDIDEI